MCGKIKGVARSGSANYSMGMKNTSGKTAVLEAASAMLVRAARGATVSMFDQVCNEMLMFLLFSFLSPRYLPSGHFAVYTAEREENEADT